MNIYVGSLHFKMNEAELKEIFEEYGEVGSAKIIIDKYSGKSKGFGFVEMASEEEVLSRTGLEIGSIPPFGSLIGLKTVMDSRLNDNSEIAFNAARHDRSVQMKLADFERIEKPTLVKID